MAITRADYSTRRSTNPVPTPATVGQSQGGFGFPASALGGPDASQNPTRGIRNPTRGIRTPSPVDYTKKATAPYTPPTPSPTTSTTSGGTSGGGQNYISPTSQIGSTSTGVAAPINPNAWQEDPTYLAEQSGYDKTLQDALAALKLQRSSYDTDYVQTLRNLGWNWEGANANDPSSVGAGSWDPNNTLGAYGMSTNSMEDAYAARCTLDSSFYRDALSNLQTDFGNQLSNVNQQRDQFTQARTADEQSANNSYTDALNRARLSALARMGM